MRAERELRRPVLACALLAFLLALGLGGAGAGWLQLRERARAEEGARRDAAVLAGSVARTLARQFEKAARHGIPFEGLPGVDGYLQRTLASVPGLAAVVVRDAGGRVLHRAEREAQRLETVAAPIAGAGTGSAGQLEVSVDAALLVRGHADAAAWTAAVVVAIAALAALVAALVVGLPLRRRGARLAGWLATAAQGDTRVPALVGEGGDGLARAEQAFAAGQAQRREQLAAFDSYAQELLAVDFDDALRPRITAIAGTVQARGEAG